MRQLILSMWILVAVSQATAEVVFLAAPRTSGKFRTQSLSEQNGPYTVHADAQLIHRDDAGAERVLIDAGALDFSVSIDGQSVLAAVVKDGRADIFRIDLATGQQTKLTHSAAGEWNCQAVEMGDGIAFLSNRDGWMNPHEKYRAFTVYRMDRYGREVMRIWHAGLGGVFGLSCGPDGRLYFASGENQGLRGGLGNNWSIWSINPDGSDFRPELSAILDEPGRGSPWDWPAITSDGSLVAASYYDTRIYGTIHVCPPFSPNRSSEPTMFGHPLYTKNPTIANGESFKRHCFQRRGMYALTPWATNQDFELRVGMVSHPAAIPGNGVYLTFTGTEGSEAMNLGVYCVPDITKAAARNSELVAVIDRVDRHEWMGRPVASFQEIYGVTEPATPGCPKDELLPVGSPFSVIGTSSVDVNEWVVYEKGKTGFKPSLAVMDANEAEYVRILSFNPTLHARMPGYRRLQSGGGGNPRLPNFEGFHSHINERVGIYGEVPLKKWETKEGQLFLGPNPPDGAQRIMRSDGRPDTSFLCEVPANQPWSLQLLNAKKEAIANSTAQTWHQTTSRERRTNCQGCHAHWSPDQVDFEDTEAASNRYRLLSQRFADIRVIVRNRDLPASIPHRPWTEGNVKAYGSESSDLDDNVAFTTEEQQLVREWIDTGMLEADLFKGKQIQPESGLGPYRDTMNPTLVVEVLKAEVAIGAHDPQSGLKSVTVNGKDMTALFDNVEHVVRLPWTADAITVIAVDNHGNETRIEKRTNVHSLANEANVNKRLLNGATGGRF